MSVKLPHKLFLLLLIGVLGITHFNISAQELITDPHFQRGLKVLDPYTGAVQGQLQWTRDNGTPVWVCAQWHSHSTLAGLAPDTLSAGWLRWANDDKTIRLGPIEQRDYDIYMGVNSIHEYGGVYRNSSQPWPALLVQQRLSAPNTFGPGCPPLSELSSLQFHVEVRLDTATIIKKNGYDPSIHAAHFPIYFIVQNLKRSSPGYGKMIWFGLHVYDDRYAFPPKYVAHDAGTNTLIYSIAYERMADVSVQSRDWVTLDVDLLPHVLDALNEAWRLGYLQQSKDPSDYKIGGMNMGWEVPGLAIVGMKVRNLSLVATSKTRVETKNSEGPNQYNLLQIFPNPFTNSTRIVLHTKGLGGRLMIVNLRGQVVRDWIIDSRPGQVLRFCWTGFSEQGDTLPSGVYFLHYKDSKIQITRRILFIR